MVATDTARGLLRPTMAAMVMAATATERGPLMLSLLLLPRLSQKPMLTTVATDMARGLLMPTMVAMDMAAMVVMDMARGLLMLMLTMAAMDMAAMVATDTDTARGLLMPTM